MGGCCSRTDARQHESDLRLHEQQQQWQQQRELEEQWRKEAPIHAQGDVACILGPRAFLSQQERELERWNREQEATVTLDDGEASVVEQGVSLAFLHGLLAQDPAAAALTPTQWAEHAVAVAEVHLGGKGRAAILLPRRGRFMETLPQQHVRRPTYFCLTEANCQLSMRQLLQLIESHVQDMDPGASTELGVWLSCCTFNPHNSQQRAAANMDSMEEWERVRQAMQQALPTLICMQQLGPGREGAARGEEIVGQQQQAGAGAANEGLPNKKGHIPAMTLYRVREGLSGFRGAMFNSPRMVFL